MKKTIAISIIVCFLLCGCVAQSDEADLTISQFGNTIGNILEGGFVVERDGHFEMVFNSENVLLNELNEPRDMGTYNYYGPQNPALHKKFDVDLYSVWENTKALYVEKLNKMKSKHM